MSGQSAVFGKRREAHTIIIARGDRIRHFTVRPWMAALAGSTVAAVTLGYFVATSYLVFRDDLLGAAVARQSRMQHAYEDRISALRAQVDRITSRQLLDQQLMETKVSELLQRQSKLSERHGRLDPVLDRAELELGDGPALDSAGDADKRADTSTINPDSTHAPAFAEAAKPSAFSFWSPRAGGDSPVSAADKADKLFVELNQSLQTIESDQMKKIAKLADNAYQTADQIADALQEAGLPIAADYGKGAMGGPLVAVDRSQIFDSKVKELDEALDRLDKVKGEAKLLPIANPAPGRPISSTFGVRKDPLLGTPALHSGMDFKAGIGFPAKTTAAGTVTKAGWNGGYGRMVEVEHGNGLSTRYAHLSKIEVSEGQKLEAGDVVGRVGSSGRSTGPHLHYEVRRDGEAVDPLRFIKVGNKVGQLL